MGYLDRARTFVFVAITVACYGVSACAPPSTSSTALSADCTRKAEKSSLDESCVIEIARTEISTRFQDANYETYKVRFDNHRRSWIVMAYNESGPPDSHTYLEISSKGQVIAVGNQR